MSHVPAEASPFSQPRRAFRFSLRELMGIVFGLALGLAAMRLPRVEWYEGLLVSAIYWIIVGLFRQILDLRLTLRRTPNLSADLRTGGRIAIAWRLNTIALLAGYCALEALRRQGLLTLPEAEGPMLEVGKALRGLLFYFALMMVTASVPRRTNPAPNDTALHRISRAVAWTAAGGLCLFAWSGGLMQKIVYLVHLAISGIENAFPLRFANPNVDLDLVARTRWFVVHVCLAAAFVPLNMWLTRRVARKWSQSGCVPWKDVAGLSMALAAAVGYLAWFYAVGLPRFSPHFAEFPTSAAPWSVWLTAGWLLLIVSGATSYRLISAFGERQPTAALGWRREPRRYDHERVWTMLALAVALGGRTVAALRAGWSSDWRITLEFHLTWPESYVIVAAFLAALYALFASFRSRGKMADAGQAALARRPFAAVWLASWLTFLIAAPLLTWFSFSLWLLLGI